jgi:hypothetical protein
MTNCILITNRENGRMMILKLVVERSTLKTKASFGSITRLEVENECLQQISNTFKFHHANARSILSSDTLYLNLFMFSIA